MGFKEKVESTVENLEGKAKEALGKNSDDKSLETEGKIDQGSAQVKETSEDVKDSF